MERERLTKREVTEELTCCDGHKPQIKRLENNTFEVIYPDGRKAIRYHHTDIITRMPNGDIVLNTGGWLTSTTKERMGHLYEYGYHIQQSDKIWYLHNTKTTQRWTYQDGMIIHSDGTVTGNGTDPKELLKLNKSILKYVDGYIKALLDKKVPKPSAGDCWYCGMQDVDSKKPLGEAIKDSRHLIDHMKEKYYVPSLVLNAIETFPVSIIAKSELGYLLGYHDQTTGYSGIVKVQVRSSLRRYMQRQLGLAT